MFPRRVDKATRGKNTKKLSEENEMQKMLLSDVNSIRCCVGDACENFGMEIFFQFFGQLMISIFLFFSFLNETPFGVLRVAKSN